MSTITSSPAAESGQFVTLGLGEELFALPVEQVREVLDVCPVTRIPNAPPSLRGMIEVRGQGVPVIDLRRKLGLAPAETTPHTRIVVLEVDVDGRHLVIGALTDRVYEVTVLDADSTEPPPEVGVRWNSAYIRGIGRRGEAFVIVLDLPKVLGAEDLAAMGAAA